MRATKRPADRGPARAGFLGVRYRPIDAEQYPVILQGDKLAYSRLWVRPRIIVYEMYNKANYHVGYCCCTFDKDYEFCNQNSYNNWKSMEKFVDTNDENRAWQIIALPEHAGINL
jgi:hypothetical protein